MGMSVLPGEKASARRRAQWRRHEGITKECSLSADAIDVWCLDVRMSGDAQLVPTQVVDEDEDNVGPGSYFRALLAQDWQ